MAKALGRPRSAAPARRVAARTGADAQGRTIGFAPTHPPRQFTLAGGGWLSRCTALAMPSGGRPCCQFCAHQAVPRERLAPPVSRSRKEIEAQKQLLSASAPRGDQDLTGFL